jgi:hypothetical protein
MLSNPVVRYVALGVVVLVLICLVGALFVRCAPALPFIGGGGGTPVQTPISMETGVPTGEVTEIPPPPTMAVMEGPTTEPAPPPAEATLLPTPTPVPIVIATPPAEEGPAPTPQGEATSTPLPVPTEGEPASPTIPPVMAQATQPSAAAAVPKTGAELIPSTGVELTLGGKPAAQDQVRGELIRNGDFEGGFTSMGVGNQWETFHNGAAFYGWYDDTWLPVVISGTHTQLIEISRSTQNDRYAGIYQTVQTVPNATYDFSISGLVRSTEGDINLSVYGYRILIGFDQNGGSDWHAVEDTAWIELPWDEQLRIAETFTKTNYMTTVTAEGDNLTVFIRCWKKWANNGEGDFDVDNISLVGPLPSETPAPTQAAAPQATVAAAPAAAAPTAQMPVSGAEGEGLVVGRWAAIVTLFILLMAVVAWRTVGRRRT